MNAWWSLYNIRYSYKSIDICSQFSVSSNYSTYHSQFNSIDPIVNWTMKISMEFWFLNLKLPSAWDDSAMKNVHTFISYTHTRTQSRQYHALSSCCFFPTWATIRSTHQCWLNEQQTNKQTKIEKNKNVDKTHHFALF